MSDTTPTSARVIYRRPRAVWSEDGTQGTCTKCGVTRPVDDFYTQSSDPDSPLFGRRLNRCKECMKLAAGKRRRESQDRIREIRFEYNLRINFRMTPFQYHALLAAQGGGCAICGTDREPNGRRLSVDHDHRTGVVRGVLCARCNVALGMFGNSIRTMARAAKYLEGSGG